MAAVAAVAASAGVLGTLVSFCDKFPAFVNGLRERQDLTGDNLTKLGLLQRHVADIRRLTRTTESDVAHDPTICTILDAHVATLEEDFKALQEWQPRIESANYTDRVNRMKTILDRCEQNVNKCFEFLSEKVAPMSRELQQQSMHHAFVPHCNVPPNPPRLTLDYGSTSTCEGKLKAAVLEEGNSRIVGVVAVGMGGVGKTCALRGLAEVEEIKRKFTGGVLYIQLGNHASLSQVISGIATLVQRTGNSSLAERFKGSRELQEAVDAASTWFQNQTCLLLIDDIWLVNGISTTVPRVLATLLSGNSRLVYTTRSQKLTDACDKEIEFTALETYSDKAREMLMVHAKFDWKVSLAQRNEDAVRGLLRICNGLPVALGVVGETVRRESRQWKDDVARSWEHVYHRILSKEESIADGDAEAYGSVRMVVDSSLEVLQSDRDDMSFGKMFRALCVVEKQQMVPIHMLRNLWGFCDLERTDEVVKAFDEVNLVRRFRANSHVLVQLHDVILDIAIRKASERYEVKTCWRSLVDNYIANEEWVREEAPKAEVKAPSEAEVVESLSREKSGLKRWYRKICCYYVNGSIDESSEQHAEDVQPGVEIEKGKWEWWNMRDDDYVHDNVCRALRGARYEKQLLWLLLQPEWIVRRLVNNGISAVERDLNVGKKVAEVHEGGNDELVRHMEMVRRAARMGCTFVSENNTVREAWFQIHGRLLSFSTVCETTKQFVAEMEARAPKPWAKASVGFLQRASTTSLDIVRVYGRVYSVQMDEERLVCCWVDGTTVGVTQYNFASGFSETQRQRCDETGTRLNIYLLQNCVELSSDLKIVVIGLPHGAIWIWNTETGRTTQSSSCHDDEVQCVAVSDDGSLIASGSKDKTVRLWEASSGSSVGHALVGHTDIIDCVAWSTDGKHIASGSRDGTICVWNVESVEVEGQALVGHTDDVVCVAWSVDGKRIVSGSKDRSVRVWDVEGGQQVGAVLVGHSDWVVCVSWSADGTRVVSGSKDDSVRVRDVSSGQILRQPLVGHTADVYCVGWSANGRHIVSGSGDWSARVWEGDSGESHAQAQCGHTAVVMCVALNRNETRALSGSSDCTVRMWDVRSGAAVGGAFVGHTAAVRCVAWSTDERRFVSGGQDKSVRVWDADSGRALGEPLVGHTNWVRCVAWSADGKHVASGGDDKSVRLWDVDSGQALGAPLIGHEQYVLCVAWSADGTQVVSGSADHKVRVWTVHSERRLTHIMSDHDGEVECVAWSYDGKLVVSGSNDKTVRVWNMANGKEVTRPLQHDAAVVEVGVNEDGSYVVSREWGTGMRRIWRVADGACVATSNDEAWGAQLHALQQQRLSTSRRSQWVDGSVAVTQRRADGSDVRLGTCDSPVERFGELWYSSATFGHCRIITE